MATDFDQQPADAAVPGNERAQPSGGGLTGRGVVVLVLLVAVAGSGVDAVVSGKLGLVFAVLFVLVCVLAAAAVRPANLLVAVIAPPLVYVVASVVAAQIGKNPPGIKRLALDSALMFATNAPTVYLATGLAGAVVLTRGLRRRNRR